ncbi:MAG: hypothetical protein AABX51_06445 [Nanoarchaeota archaeon]
MVLNETAQILTAPESIGEIGSWLSGTLFPWIPYFITEELFPRITELVFSPLQQTEMLWVVLPLLAALILMTFYFGAHKSEELGWNTAFGNSMVLIFTSINLLQRLYGNISIDTLVFNEDTIIALVLFGEGILLMFLDFFHFLPKRIAFYISSPVHVNLLATLGVIIVYSENIALDGLTAIAIVLLYIFVGVILWILKKLIPGARERIEFMTDQSFAEFKK